MWLDDIVTSADTLTNLDVARIDYTTKLMDMVHGDTGPPLIWDGVSLLGKSNMSRQRRVSTAHALSASPCFGAERGAPETTYALDWLIPRPQMPIYRHVHNVRSSGRRQAA